jgi:hypothetical protein
MSEATVGQILGYLRLDASDWNRELEQAGRKSDELGRKSPNIKIGTNAAETITKLEAVAAATRKLQDAQGRATVAQVKLIDLQRKGNASATQLKSAEEALARSQRAVTTATAGLGMAQLKASEAGGKLGESNKKVGDSSKDAGKGLGLMATSIIALGPALVPLSAAAVGLGGAFGGMGAAGILAIVGIKNEMKAGTALGQQYSAQIGTLKGNLDTLSHTAAAGVLSAFQKDVQSLQGQMPFLNGMVANFSTLLGRSSTNLLTGVIAGLHVLEPLMMQAGVYIDGLTAKFAAAAGGSGMQAFASYAQSVLPQVTAALESIAGAAVHLVAAFAGVGVGVVGELKVLSDIISAIPLPVLSQLASAAVSVTIAFQAWKGLSGVVDSIGGAMGKFAATAEMAAGATRALSLAAGGISAVIAIATFAYQAHAQSVAQAQQAVDGYTQALRDSNGVIDESIRLKAAQALADSGLLAMGQQMHLNTADMVSSALGQADATARVTAQINANREAMRGQVNATGASGAAYDDYNGKAAAVLKGISGQNAALNGGKQAWANQQAAVEAASGATTAQNAAQAQLAAGMGITVGALQAAEAGQKKTADAAAVATQKMQLENDAAGLLKGALDALNGKALSAADAQNAFDSSLTNMAAATDKAGKKVKITAGNINGMSTAAVGIRGTLNGQIHALEGVIEANGGLANSTGKARDQMKTMRQQIIDNAYAHGMDKKAVADYIDKLLKVPKSVPPTKLDVDKRAADAKLAALQAKRDAATAARQIYIGAGVTQALSGIAAVQAAANNLHGKTITITTVSNHVAGTTSGDVIGHGSRTPGNGAATGGTIGRLAFGGTVGGNGGPRADDQPFMGPHGLVMLSSGEEVIKNGPAQKYRPLLKAINAGKFAGGGTIGAAGLAPDMQEIMSLFAAGQVTWAQVQAAQARVGTARKSVTSATTSLHNYQVSAGAAGRSVAAARANLAAVDAGHMVGTGRHRHVVGPTALQRRAAEDRLTSALEHQRKVNGQVSAAEDKLAASRKGVTAATKDANALTARYKTPAIDQFKSATKASNRMSSSFLANLTTLASRGFTTLARSLLEDGSPQAQTIAAQAVKSTAKAKGLEADLKSSAKTEAGIHALDDKLNGVNQPPAQLKAVTLRAGESLTIGGQVVKGAPTKVFPQPSHGGQPTYGQPQQVHLSPDSMGQLIRGIAARPVMIDGKSLARPMQTELVRGLRP